MTHADILLVDDDPGAIQLMGRILVDLGNLRFATGGVDALRLAREHAPDVMLLDAEMPGMSGFETLAAMKADAALVDVAVIFVTSHDEPAFEVSGFELGAVDFIAKPVSALLLRARVKTQLRIKRLSDELRRMATIDVLTEVANRRLFDESLAREWRRVRRVGDPLSLLMIDVDHFKRFNDAYGHPAGDACLRRVAQALAAASLRPADLVARYGGEEFAILLPQTPRGGAEHVARAALREVEALGIVHEGSTTAAHVSVSVGVACYDDERVLAAPVIQVARPDGDGDGDGGTEAGPERCSAAQLVQAADEALYAAKSAGRARAKLLDIADVDAPERARDVSTRTRTPSAPLRV